MTLEYWDSRRQKYVLYWNVEKHHEDCERFPFERIPKRVFLDTSVINVLVKHCEQIFDRSPIPANTDPKLALDVEALMHIFFVGSRADWDILGYRG